MRSPQQQGKLYSWRYYLLLFVVVFATALLLWRMLFLTVIDRSFLRRQGEIRSIRTVSIPAYRGMITDRNGDPLAISTPVVSIWANPKDFDFKSKDLSKFAELLGISKSTMVKRLRRDANKEFVYLRRGLSPAKAKKILALNIPGVNKQREFKRFYPEGEVTAHLLGFTNIDDRGQEGLELAYNHWLRGIPGKKRVLKDRLGHIVEDLALIQEPQPGHRLVLSVDRRIQYLAYRTLKNSVQKNKAKSGSIVVLDAQTGEVLAMANAPSYNPNRRPAIHDGRYRNRAVTDLFEPGSVIKAFSITSALDSGKYTPESIVNTSPGWLMLDGHRVHDHHDNGPLTVTQILQKSSNVGVTKITLSLPPEQLWGLLHRVGFGERTTSGFPGEANGVLVDHRRWRPFALATLAFGYGISVTDLQLAHAYSVFAHRGKLLPISLLKLDTVHRKLAEEKARQVISPSIAKQMLEMLHAVVETGGTGRRARVRGYTVAGKTGTARIAKVGGYEENHHIATFVGIAPLSNPRLVIAVVINDPQAGQYYGGVVAAPVFSKVMSGALRMLDVLPDKISMRYTQLKDVLHANQYLHGKQLAQHHYLLHRFMA